MPPLEKLDVLTMSRPIFDNYDRHVDNFVSFLKTRLQCTLVYEGSSDIHTHIRNRTVYACSVRRSNKKFLSDVFPVMIGSKLDLAIRQGRRSFEDLTTEQPPFSDLDIARGFFIVNGFVRHLPYFYTNDPTNTHLIQKKWVRVYTYDAHDRGKELSYYAADYGDFKAGELFVVHNDGKKSRENVDAFFDHSPYPVHPEAYMIHVHRQDSFDIDHLANKTVVSPGHLFVKLFVKYLYGPLRDEGHNWSLIKSKTALVVKSIQSGNLLHVLSRKTLYFKEGKSAGKMTNTPHESPREINANGDVFIEKNVGCYREVNTQTYPLNPYLLHLVVRQMSNKVKKDTVPALHPSYIGFLGILSCFETKNVGRTMMMVRNSMISTCDDLDPVFHDVNRESSVWDALQLTYQAASEYHVVVNEACIPVTRASFHRLDLSMLKRRFRTIECYEESGGCFIYVRYKVGLFFKRMGDIWVTCRDEMYWAKLSLGLDSKEQLIERFGYDYVTSYLVDLNPFFMHNAFPKNILAFNSLKNAVLATDQRYAVYFLATATVHYRRLTPYHRVVVPAVDEFSKHFELRMPKILVAYASHQGSAQEDCIVRHERVDAFDCVRFYTLRVKFSTAGGGGVTFFPVQGDCSDDLLGTLVGQCESLQVDPNSIHVKVDRLFPNQVNLRFNKPPFRVIQYFLGNDILSICVEQDHPSGTGDKLCNLHGQKGVMRITDQMPVLDGNVHPDALVNAYLLFRMTVGIFREGLEWGDGADATTIHNSDGTLLVGQEAFYAHMFYFSVAYWADEHLHAPEECVQDKLLGQSVKGRSRGGGMRLGNMELMNGLRGNGIASCYDTKFNEHGDRIEGSTIPKSVGLVQQDARFFKCNLEYEIQPSVVEIDE